jgi:hypothetical protein
MGNYLPAVNFGQVCVVLESKYDASCCNPFLPVCHPDKHINQLINMDHNTSA